MNINALFFLFRMLLIKPNFIKTKNIIAFAAPILFIAGLITAQNIGFENKMKVKYLVLIM